MFKNDYLDLAVWLYFYNDARKQREEEAEIFPHLNISGGQGACRCCRAASLFEVFLVLPSKEEEDDDNNGSLFEV